MIGIMDWGIGGLSVYKALRNSGHMADVTYLSDSGATPYGKLTRTDLRKRLQLVSRFFNKQNINSVYVACNAASSALDADSELIEGIMFHSIIPSGVKVSNEHLKNPEVKTIGVIGGNLTIESQIYQSRFSENISRFKFESAQPLSAFVEAGQLSGPDVENSIKDVLRRLGNIDALLLACTHYPALNSVFKRTNASIKLIDPAIQMVNEIISNEGKRTSSEEFLFFTTGDFEKTQKSALAAFQIETKFGQKIELENL